jgi:hypothetical protein
LIHDRAGVNVNHVDRQCAVTRQGEVSHRVEIALFAANIEFQAEKKTAVNRLPLSAPKVMAHRESDTSSLQVAPTSTSKKQPGQVDLAGVVVDDVVRNAPEHGVAQLILYNMAPEEEEEKAK